jgi:hypothetical protein
MDLFSKQYGIAEVAGGLADRDGVARFLDSKRGTWNRDNLKPEESVE